MVQGADKFRPNDGNLDSAFKAGANDKGVTGQDFSYKRNMKKRTKGTQNPPKSTSQKFYDYEQKK